jgi:hypothetical protein
MALPTAFDPAEREVPDRVRQQYEKLSALPFVREFLNAVPNMSVVLNERRQIVFANRSFAEFLGLKSELELLGATEDGRGSLISRRVLGQRPGEAVGCVRANLTEGGCGTTEFCRNCGAGVAIHNSQRNHSEDVQECRLQLSDECGRDTALDLRVWARPIDVEDEQFTMFSLLDISGEKRRGALERIFFHDVLNTAGGVKGLAELMAQDDIPVANVHDAAVMLAESAHQLVEEISAQRMLSDAERGDLQVQAHPARALDLLRQTRNQFLTSGVAAGKTIA